MIQQLIQERFGVFYNARYIVSFRQGCMNFDGGSGNVEAPRTW
jgi:hypothetical protein